MSGVLLGGMLESLGLAGGRGASWTVVTAFLLAFPIAFMSLAVFMFCGGRLLLRRARAGDYDEARDDALRVVDDAADAGWRHAAVAIERGSEEYERVKPKVAAAAKRGRETFDADVRPRLKDGAGGAAKGAGTAAKIGRDWLEKRRYQRRGDA